uniref:Uncharacterized protein n=1 Tax=Strigamia maritima TaxID=126957 RepID=T1J344_STRMM
MQNNESSTVSTLLIGLTTIVLPLLLGIQGLILEENNQITSSRSIMENFSFFMMNGFSDLLYTLADNPLKGFPGLDPDECVKRSICEAHNHPDRYGWLAFPFQLFFPPYSGHQRDDDSEYFSQYRLAARYGKSDNADCARQYWGCMFNPLLIIQTIVD